jgi:hypothetical protein
MGKCPVRHDNRKAVLLAVRRSSDVQVSWAFVYLTSSKFSPGIRARYVASGVVGDSKSTSR